MHPPSATSSEPPLPAWFFLLTGFMVAVSAVWAFEMVICEGVLAGTVSALVRLTLHAVFGIETGLVVLLIWGGGAGLAWTLARHPFFRKRQALLLFLLPLAALPAGLAAGGSTLFSVACALGPWR